ncbi:hypothetical protein [Streptomyces sp. UNOC14_S4]|uniref:hypothetical protein n=1 Tax=Streptomyces sp. UNOC14_S4 TaxID=2872340 RepID=UPI0035AF449A|nr:hypothetical protein [Streptomyces sp. UNOC14_S4]
MSVVGDAGCGSGLCGFVVRGWPVERMNTWGNQFFKIARCAERRAEVAHAYISLAHAVITLRRLIRRSWTFYRWDTRPGKRP